MSYIADKKRRVTTLRNHERRIKSIEDKQTGVITEKNIYKTITDIAATFDTVEVWVQGTGASSLYDLSRYDTESKVYDPVSATLWVKVRDVST